MLHWMHRITRSKFKFLMADNVENATIKTLAEIGLLDSFPIMYASKKSQLFHQTDNLSEIYILLYGNINLERLTRNGDIILSILRDGDFIGTLTEKKQITGAYAKTDAYLLEIPKLSLPDLQKNPVFNAKLNQYYDRLWDYGIRRLEWLSERQAPKRIMLAVDFLDSEVFGQNGVIPLTHYEMADLTLLSRETATKACSELDRMGVMIESLNGSRKFDMKKIRNGSLAEVA